MQLIFLKYAFYSETPDSPSGTPLLPSTTPTPFPQGNDVVLIANSPQYPDGMGGSKSVISVPFWPGAGNWYRQVPQPVHGSSGGGGNRKEYSPVFVPATRTDILTVLADVELFLVK